VAVGWYELSSGIVAIFTSWCLYSTLYGKSNPFRSYAQASFIGWSMGMNVVVATWFAYEHGYLPLLEGEWIMLLGIILGVMMLFRLHPKYHYIARLPIAISVGTMLSFSLRTTIFTGFISQIQATMLPLYVPGDLLKSLYNTTLVVSTLLMLSFFVYTTELRGPMIWSARIGEYCMYIAFGCVFAQTFMGRLGLFVGYMQNITDPAWKIPYTLSFAVLIFLAILVMDRYGILEKYAD